MPKEFTLFARDSLFGYLGPGRGNVSLQQGYALFLDEGRTLGHIERIFLPFLFFKRGPFDLDSDSQSKYTITYLLEYGGVNDQ